MLRRQFAARLSLLPVILTTSRCSGRPAEYSPQISPAGGGYPQDGGQEGGLRGVVDQVMRPVVDNDAIPGTIVGISLRGARHFFRYSTGGEQLAPDTIVEIGSITKVFTTALLAQAIQDSSIWSDASIQSYLPNTRLQRCASAVTPVQLASFRSGMPSLPTDTPRRFNERDLGEYTMGDFLNWVSQWSPAGCQLPASYEYSNASVGLLGPILANARGVLWERQIETSITGPLGMRDTSIRPGPETQGRVAQGYGPAGRPVIPWPVFAWFAAGALRSTAQDMLCFGEAALGHPTVAGRPVPPRLTSALRLAMTPVYQPVGKPFQQAMAWEVRGDGRGAPVASKDGGTDGFNSVLLVDAARDAAVFIAADKARSGIPRAGLKLMQQIA